MHLKLAQFFPSLLLLLLLLVQVEADNGQLFWHNRFRRQAVDSATTNVSVPMGGGGGTQIAGNNYQDLMFVNNGCVYHNGYITENGGQPRKATEAEQAQVQSHMRSMEQYQQQFQRNMAQQMQQMNEQMRQMFAPPFPFGSSQQQQNFSGGFQMPPFPQMQMPNFPCFCESCRQNRAANNQYNQYSFASNQGGVQQQQQQQQMMNNQVNVNWSADYLTVWVCQNWNLTRKKTGKLLHWIFE